MPSVSVGDWVAQRQRNMAAGIPSNADPLISFVPGGAANNAPDWYQFDKNNFAPRASFAWTLTPKMSLRGGYFLVYDRIGSGLATQFNNVGSFGLATQLSSPFGVNNETNAAIWTFGDLEPGRYRVEVTWPDADSRSDEVTYFVRGSNTAQVVSGLTLFQNGLTRTAETAGTGARQVTIDTTNARRWSSSFGFWKSPISRFS